MKRQLLLGLVCLVWGGTVALAQHVGRAPEKMEIPLARKPTASYLGFTLNIPLWKLIGDRKQRLLNKAKQSTVRLQEREEINLVEDDRLLFPVIEPIEIDLSKVGVGKRKEPVSAPPPMIRRELLYQSSSQSGTLVYDKQLRQSGMEVWNKALSLKTNDGGKPISADQPYTLSSDCSAWECYYEPMPYPEDGTAYAHHESSDGQNYCESVVWVNGRTYVLEYATENFCVPYNPYDPPYDPYPGGGGGGGGSGPSSLDYSFVVETLNCNAYGALNSYASSSNKEHGAVITTDGHLIILPSAGNAIDKTDFGMVYEDEQHRTITSIYEDGGKWYIQVNYYNNGVGTPVIYEISGMIHTHPVGTAPNGQPWDTYNPSGDDIRLLDTFPGINQYISAPDKTFQYNSSGPIPSSSAPNSSC